MPPPPLPAKVSVPAQSAGGSPLLVHPAYASPVTHFRWVILGLVFSGTLINYVDRQVMSILGPYLREHFDISKPQWGNINSAFAWSYAFGQLLAGGILDRIGVRIGYPLGLALWSIVSMLHAGAIGLGGAIASVLGNPWISVLLLGMATAGHQGFSSNIYTLVSDTFPRRAVAGVAGLGGTFGYIGAALFSSLTGYILKWTNDKYVILFIIAGSAYLIAFAIIHLLMPRLDPALIDEPRGFEVHTRGS